jgi:hypothetical protein
MGSAETFTPEKARATENTTDSASTAAAIYAQLNLYDRFIPKTPPFAFARAAHSGFYEFYHKKRRFAMANNVVSPRIRQVLLPYLLPQLSYMYATVKKSLPTPAQNLIL